MTMDEDYSGAAEGFAARAQLKDDPNVSMTLQVLANSEEGEFNLLLSPDAEIRELQNMLTVARGDRMKTDLEITREFVANWRAAGNKILTSKGNQDERLAEILADFLTYLRKRGMMSK